MNKIKLFLLAAIITLSASSASAQKAGYINMDQLLMLMPEVAKIDTILQKFQADTLNMEYASMIEEYKYKDSIMNRKDTATMPASVKRQHRQDMEGLVYQIQNWQAITQQAMQGKQQELLQPIYTKAMNAVTQVAKENGYAYVYNREALLVAPPADDLLPLVAKKLNIKMPPATATTPKK